MKRDLPCFLPEFGEHCFERGQDFVDCLPTAHTFEGKPYSPGLTFKKDHPEVDFELLDPLGYSAARQVQLVRSALKVAVPRHASEHPKRIEVHLLHERGLRR